MTNPPPIPPQIPTASAPLKRFRYKVIQLEKSLMKLPDSVRFEQMLNEMGWQGWELVNTYTLAGNQGMSQFLCAAFKQPIE